VLKDFSCLRVVAVTAKKIYGGFLFSPLQANRWKIICDTAQNSPAGEFLEQRTGVTLGFN